MPSDSTSTSPPPPPHFESTPLRRLTTRSIPLALSAAQREMPRDMEAAVEGDGDAAPIAAFAVSKGGVVIKHIFLNAPPPELTRRNGSAAEEEEDPPVTVGRHPDCHVLVDHPSVSRFHLELRARRRQRQITVTDLSSVHGTWVSGRRIPPNTPVDLAAGDTLRLGASRREYCLLWLSLREAFEMEDPLPPLIEEDKEEARTCQDASNKLVPVQRPPLVDVGIHKDTSQKIVSENIAFPEVIPSAPPLPEYTHSFYQDESALSQFHENSVEVANFVDKRPVSESLEDTPAAVTNAGRPVQSAKQEASSQVSKRAKLKSVKSLRVDTGRNRDRSSTWSYSFQKEDQKDIAVCSQNCGTECAACIALFGILECEGSHQKEEMIAEEKGHIDAPASIAMEGNKKELANPENYIPQESFDERSEKSLGLLHPLELSQPVLENTSVSEVKLNGSTTLNLEGSILNNQNMSPWKVAQGPGGYQFEGTTCENPFGNLDTIGFQGNEENSLLDKENITPYVAGNIITERSSSFQKEDQKDIAVCFQNCGTECATCIALFGISECEGSHQKEEVIAEEKGHIDAPASITMEGNKRELANPENYIPQESFDERSEKSLGLLHPLELSQPVLENTSVPELKLNGSTTLNLEGSILNNENMSPWKVAEGPGDCQFERTACENPFGNLDTIGFQGNEENSPLDKENITPCVSANIITDRSNRSLKPIISAELMDSISPFHLEPDISSEKENSMLNIGSEMKSNEPTSEKLSSLISADTKLQQNQESMPVSNLEFKGDILLDRENSVLTSGKYGVISPVKQEDMFSDKEIVTPASRDRKLSVRRVLGSRIDDSVSAEKTSNMSIQKRECNELPAKSKGSHTVDDDVFYSDKENLTPVSSRGAKARKCLPKNLTTISDADQDQEAFFSDKENLTPLSSARKTKDMSENRARIESVITKKRVADRHPFQTLMSNSPLRPTSSLDCNCAVSGVIGVRLEDELDKVSCKHQESGRAGQEMKAWTMVADTDSLLDDESRKSIMLLRGIKGTHLIIPQIVIRELDSMKQREGLFRRSSKATSILRWIDECMESEGWWIHVQSTSEMFPVAPTPPATPSAQCIDEEIKFSSSSFNPMALFSPRSFADIVSPKPEDRVLDCALLFKQLRSEQRMIVLSHSITLKIKAMAEGLLCEGAKEFRGSLMNPCSDRFMWAASVPRGSAWSCLDEAALAENYYNSHHHARKRTPRPVEAAAKGLKLILRHNSLFAQATKLPTPSGGASLASP